MTDRKTLKYMFNKVVNYDFSINGDYDGPLQDKGDFLPPVEADVFKIHRNLLKSDPEYQAAYQQLKDDNKAFYQKFNREFKQLSRLADPVFNKTTVPITAAFLLTLSAVEYIRNLPLILRVSKSEDKMFGIYEKAKANISCPS